MLPQRLFALHDKVNVHEFAEVAQLLGVIAVGDDDVLAADVLRKFFHGARIGEDLQRRQLRRGIVPAVLVPRGRRLGLAGVDMHAVAAVHVGKARAGHIIYEKV